MTQEEVRTWRYDVCEKPSPSNVEDVVDKISSLCNQNGVVMMLLRPGARLADDRTKGQFLTDLHQFYLDKRCPHDCALNEVRQTE